MVRLSRRERWTRIQIYHGYRAEGHRAAWAWHAALVRVRFEALEERGLVRLHAVPEIDSYDEDFSHLRPSERKRVEEEIQGKIARDGLWIWLGQYRTRDDLPERWGLSFVRQELGEHEHWETADSIGMIIGANLDDFYRIDLMDHAVRALEDAWQNEADELASRGTFAAGAGPWA